MAENNDSEIVSLILSAQLPSANARIAFRQMKAAEDLARSAGAIEILLGQIAKSLSAPQHDFNPVVSEEDWARFKAAAKNHSLKKDEVADDAADL